MDAVDPVVERRIRGSFSRQTIMGTLGAELLKVAPGDVEIGLRWREDLCQQHGFLHAGVVTTVVDSACGYAALSLMPADAGVLSVEFKVNLLAPARGERFVARGTVRKAGRTLMVCEGELAADGEKTVAIMLATMMVVKGRGDVRD